MEGPGPGTQLGERYTVRQRAEVTADWERWTATDEHLQREVSVFCFSATHPYAAAALDAARQVAPVDNPRLVRVLDVGSDARFGYVIEESLGNAQSLATLSESGNLAAEEVRRLVGEASLGLEAASQRGLHHLLLSPECLVRLPRGAVKVLGLAVAAALAGREEQAPAEAARTDTVGLVAVLYAGLTGTWPSSRVPSQLPSARRVVGGVPSPSEVVGYAPADLDTICRLTLNDDVGPTSPGDLAGQIAPWSLAQVDDATSLTPGIARTSSARQDQTTARLRPVADPTTERTDKTSAKAKSGALTSADSPEDQDADLTVTRSSDSRDTGRPMLVDPVLVDPVGLGPGAANGTAAAIGGAAPAIGGAIGGGIPRPLTPGPEDSNDEPVEEASGTRFLSEAFGSATSAATRAADALRGRTGDLSRAVRVRAQERRDAHQRAHEWTEEHRVPFEETLAAAELGPAEPSAPLMPADLSEPLDESDSRLALVIIAGLLVVALAFGLWGVTRIGANTDLGLSDKPPILSQPTSPNATPSSSSSSTPPTTATTTNVDAGATIPIRGLAAYDPQGDNLENTAELGRMLDNNPATFWRSEGYNSPDFGGLKTGVGFSVDLGSATGVGSVVLDLTSAATVTAYAGNSAGTNGTQASASTNRAGTVTLTFPANTTAQVVTVWFTRLDAATNGRYRALVTSVSLRR